MTLLLLVLPLAAFAVYRAKFVSRLFLIVFFSYYLLGVLASSLVGLNEGVLELYAIAFLSLSVGTLLIKNDDVSLDFFIYEDEIKRSLLMKVSVGAISLIAIASFMVIILVYGIPMLNPGERHHVSPYLTYLVSLLWVNFPAVYFFFKRTTIFNYFLASVVIFLMMGYRSPILIISAFFFLLNLNWPRVRFSFKRKLFVGAFLVLVAGFFATLRFDDTTRLDKIMQNLGVPEVLRPVAPIYFAFAEGYIVNSAIVDLVDKLGWQYGGFTAAAFSTILPGKQVHSRNKLSQWMGRDNWEESSTTPTLIGQVYLEGGTYFVGFFFLLLGAFVSSFSKIIRHCGAISKYYLYMVPYTFLLLGIHTGILDPITIFVAAYYFAFLSLLSMFVLNRKVAT